MIQARTPRGTGSHSDLMNVSSGRHVFMWKAVSPARGKMEGEDVLGEGGADEWVNWVWWTVIRDLGSVPEESVVERDTERRGDWKLKEREKISMMMGGWNEGIDYPESFVGMELSKSKVRFKLTELCVLIDEAANVFIDTFVSTDGSFLWSVLLKIVGALLSTMKRSGVPRVSEVDLETPAGIANANLTQVNDTMIGNICNEKNVEIERIARLNLNDERPLRGESTELR